MLSLIGLHAIVFLAIISSLIGTVCILRGLKVFDLNISVRNFMYLGACGAMCFGFIGAIFCLGSLITTPWHYLIAATLFVMSAFATAHLAIDLEERLSAL